MQKLIVHIGAGKCGSSAIQAYLGANAATLRAQGVLIPGLDLTLNAGVAGQQINFFLNLLNSSPSAQAPHQPVRPDAASIVRRRLAALKEEMVRSGLHTLVVSAENLSNQHAFSSLFSAEKAHFDVHIVAYIRRQDEYLSSSWGQWYVKAYDSIDEYLSARVPFDGDWHAMLTPWLRDFGRDHVHVRLFDRKSLYNGDVVDDFLNITGLPIDASHKRVGVVNESNDERLIALARHVRNEFSSIHDTSFYDVMNGVLGKENRKEKSKPYLFDRTRRLKIMDAYSGSNEKIRNTFFTGIPSGTPLFPPPDENDVLDLSPVEKLEREVSMLTKVVYALARKLAEPPKEMPLARSVSVSAKGNPVATQIIGAIAVPGSKVLREALGSPWYAERNQDVWNAGFDPYAHWCDFGMKEGRLPAPDLEKLMAALSAERNALSQQNSGLPQTGSQPGSSSPSNKP